MSTSNGATEAPVTAVGQTADGLDLSADDVWKLWATRIVLLAKELPDIKAQKFESYHKACTFLVKNMKGKITLPVFNTHDTVAAWLFLCKIVIKHLITIGLVQCPMPPSLKQASSAGQGSSVTQPCTAGSQAQTGTKTEPRQKVKGFTGTISERDSWADRITEAVKIPENSRPREFYSRNAAQKFLADAIYEKFNVPVFQDYDVHCKWEDACRQALDALKRKGQIKFPTARELWEAQKHSTGSARFVSIIATGKGIDHTSAPGAADSGHAKYNAGWDAGHEIGRSEGFSDGKSEGKAEALSEVVKAVQQIVQRQPVNDTASSQSAQLEACLDKLELKKPVAEDQTLFCAFGGRPGSLGAASGNRHEPPTYESSREGSVSSLDSQPPVEPLFPNRVARHVFQNPTDVSTSSTSTMFSGSRPSPSPATGVSFLSPFANASSGTSWLKPQHANESAFTAPGPSTSKEAATHTLQSAVKTVEGAARSSFETKPPPMIFDSRRPRCGGTSPFSGLPNIGKPALSSGSAPKPVVDSVDQHVPEAGAASRKRRLSESSAESGELLESGELRTSKKVFG